MSVNVFDFNALKLALEYTASGQFSLELFLLRKREELVLSQGVRHRYGLRG